jgi:hypothetical protein
MQDEIASFLSFQIRRSSESGDTEQAMTQLRQFLELERESKCSSMERGQEPANVRKFPGLRAVN